MLRRVTCFVFLLLITSACSSESDDSKAAGSGGTQSSGAGGNAGMAAASGGAGGGADAGGTGAAGAAGAGADGGAGTSGAAGIDAGADCPADTVFCNRCLAPGETEGNCTVLSRTPSMGGMGVSIVNGQPYFVGDFGVFTLSADGISASRLLELQRTSAFDGELYGYDSPYLSRYSIDGQLIARLAESAEPEGNVVRVGDWVAYVVGYVDTFLVRAPYAGIEDALAAGTPSDGGPSPFLPEDIHALGSGLPASHLDTDGQYIYWGQNSGIYRQAPDEAVPTLISDWFVSLPILQDQSFYFYAGDGRSIPRTGRSLFRMPIAGGEPVELAQADSDNYAHVAGEHVYFIDKVEAALYRVAIAGGERERVASLAPRYHLTCSSMASTATQLYLPCTHLLRIDLP